MSEIKESTLDLIGETPLLRLGRYIKAVGIQGVDVLGKLEAFNTSGSVKDRVALSMIEDAERKGIIKEGATIIEPTKRKYRNWSCRCCSSKRLQSSSYTA